MERAGQKGGPLPLRKRDASRLNAGEILFRPAPGQLFIHEPSHADCRQGFIGDCYLLCAFSAVARTSPEKIRAMIAHRPGGDYTVRFFKLQPDGTRAAEPVRIDGRVPVAAKDGLPMYARTMPDVQGNREIWPLIAEKAYAAWKGGYDVIGEGGAVEDTLEELTGEPSRVFYVSETHPEMLWNLLRRATDEQWPTAVCSYGRVARPELDEFGFHPWHIHVFLGVHVWNGRRIVWLRDPFDNPQAGTVNLPDPNGVFTLAWEHFLTYFAEVIINQREIAAFPVPAYPVRTIRQALENSYVFKPLPEAAKRSLAKDFKRVRVAEGTPVFRHGTVPHHYYLIHSGSAAVLSAPAGRPQQTLAVLGAGDQFGEMALINDTLRGAEIRALSPLVLYSLSAAKFRSWLERFPEMDARFRRRFVFQQWMEKWSKRQITSVSLDMLLESGCEERLDADAVLYREGDEAAAFYLILEGCMESYREEAGVCRSLEMRGPGEILGATAALHGVNRQASARAREFCQMLRIDIHAAARVMENFASLQRQLAFVARQGVRRRRKRDRDR